MRKRPAPFQHAFQGPSPWIIGICSLLVINRLLGVDRWLLVGIRENELADKAGHFLFFGLLAFLVHLMLRSKTAWMKGRIVAIAFLTVALLAVIDEVSQHWVARRTVDPWDLCANFLGIIILGPMALFFRTGSDEEREDFARVSRLRSHSKPPSEAELEAGLRMSANNQNQRVNGSISHQPRLSRDQRGRQLI